MLKEEFLAYWDSLWRDIPLYVYEIEVAVFCVGTAICLYRWGIRKGLRWSAGLLLIEYAGLIYCSTVIFRGTGKLQYDFMPLWSYFSYFRGEDDRLLTENIMNMVVFVPVGVLLGAVFRSMSWKKVLVIGMCLSVGIEVLQFVFRKGFSEVDDVIHNTLGCMLGYGLFRMISWRINK